MSNDRVYCCNKEATCNNYERSELVFFEQVKFEKVLYGKNGKLRAFAGYFY